MVRGMRSAVRASWLTLLLAAALAFTLPSVASMAGAAAAAPSPGAHPVWAAAATRPGALHTTAPHIRHAERTVDRSTRRHDAPAPVPPQHAGWDLASELVHVPVGGLTAHAEPAADSRVVGTVVGTSKYYHVPMVLWLMDVRHGWGRVELPYVWPRAAGWIQITGLARTQTFIHVDVDLSQHRVRVYKHTALLASAPAAIGAPSTPTPPGHYVVTDRVPFPAGGPLGTFAFGISGIQTHLPAGWSGGNQLAIHGTDVPSSIGTSASAGCVRVREATLAMLKPLLRLGTPVVIHA
jgi:lipoprotein-anchoring transpeptidase ErfK/SrfK